MRNLSNNWISSRCLFLCLLLFLSHYWTSAQSFNSSNVAGESLSNPTSLDFGPDGRLYVSQQDGTIYAYTIQRNGPNNYQIVNTQTILLVKQITNHNDNGSVNNSENDRQITGLLTAGTASNPILFVSSSDPRIGGGEAGGVGDVNLDTNSGVISRLTWNGSSWVKVDLVKGLPRSEENHSVNGMQYDAAANILYLAMGGSTNAGSPSVNFTYITEYALSASILSIDLDMIENNFGGSYDLPTLDDPTRANTGPGGADVGDPFGGNDGLNQAKLVIGGPVQIHSPGYRNAYDLVLTTTAGREGRLYTIDNGANGGWGGFPENEGTPNVTNNYVPGEPGSTQPGPPVPVNNLDNLHYVSGPGFGPIYGGHPNPIRANPAGAGLYRRDDSNQEFFELNPTSDWPPVPVSLANPIEGDFQNPGVDDGALYTWDKSTNGIVEYTATNFFGGSMAGDLLAASFNGVIHRIELSPDGQSVTNVEVFASGFGNIPLDVTAQGTGEMFEGTVWAVTYGSDNLTVFEPDTPPDDGWVFEVSSNNPTARHESSYVQAGGLFYLIGGRGNKPLDIYDPVAQSWSTGSPPPLEIHHFQAITYQGDIYVVGGFTGSFPNETPLTNIYIYDPGSDTWSTGPTIPALRRRGSTGIAVYNNKIYMVGGIQNGHINGWVPWLDEYDPSTGTWTALADAPRSRDHFQVGIVGSKLYAVGGRRTGQTTTFLPTIPEVDVYDFNTGTWSTLAASANIPTERAGATTVVANGQVIVIGGESGSQASGHQETEAYNPQSNSWTALDPLNTGRHGTQALVYDAKIYIAAGSANKGGGPELSSQEFLDLGINCSGDINNFNVDDDSDGYSNGDETLNGTDPCSAASKPEDNDGDFLSDLLDDDDDNDGLLDTVDAFALDAQNGTTTSLPVDYPFLNGDPGFGLFGMGYTGLMTDQSTDYLDLFDENDPGLIMGGASGIATVPASSGDATTNDQEYAFQFGVNVNSLSPVFVVHSNIQGTPFFNGSFQDQTQGVYIGNGDQDNYLKFVLAANNGTGALQLLAENNGSVVLDVMFNVANILQEFSINLFLEIDPTAGTVQPKYSTGSNSSMVALGSPISLTGTVLATLQSNDALAVGMIASSGSAPSFQASWDFIEIDPQINTQNLHRINSGGPAFTFGSENWSADQYNDANLTYTNAVPIANTLNDQLYQTEANSSTGGFTYNIPVPASGNYTVNLHFAEIFHGVENGNGAGARFFNVNIENSQAVLTNYDIIAAAGGPATAVIETFSGINVTDGNMTITYTSVQDRAKSSGVEVFSETLESAPVVSNPGTQLFNEGETVSFQIVASDPNPGDVITYSANGLPGTLSINPSTGLISGDITDPTGNYNVTVRVTDNGGLFTEINFVVSVNNYQPLLRINAGGPAFTFNSENWIADQYGDAGQSYTNVVPISNTLNDVLYQTESYDNSGGFTYNLPVPNPGQYAVRLHFAEIFHGVENGNGVGSRVFNFDVENGQAQVTNYDIIAESGGPATAITAAFSDITVNDGALTLNFSSTVNNAKLSGIELFNIQGPPLSPVVLNPGDQLYNQGESAIIQIVASDANVGDVLTYTATGLPGSLSIDPITGIITGNTNSALADYSVTVRVTDDGGLFDEETFTLTIGSFNALYRINSGGPAFVESASSTGFQEQNGLVIIEAESAPVASNWGQGTDGSITYYEATQNTFANPALSGKLSYNIEISNPGIYRIEWRSKINQGSSSTQSNDSWLKLPNDADVVFFGYQGTVTSEAQLDADLQNETNVVFPIGSGLEGPQTTPNGEGGDGFFKVFMNSLSGWVWTSSTSDSDAHNIYVKFNSPGIYNMQIGNRSSGHAIDRVALYKIDTYGDDYSDTQLTNAAESPVGGSGSGIQWSADQFNDGANVFNNAVPIAATNNDVLYQTERVDNNGSFSYNIPVPTSGIYAARLHFAEIYFGVETSSGIGARVFNVNIENNQGQLTNYDIIAHAGGPATAIITAFNDINVSDGFFTISFNGLVNNPKISGIELFSVIGPPAAPIVTAPSDQIFNQGESVNIQVNANDPNVGDMISYSATGLPGGLTIDPVTGLITGSLTGANGVYNVDIEATDDGGLTGTASFVITIGSFSPIARINSGGPAYSFNGINWAVDQYHDGNNLYSNAIPINATDNDQLYQTERFDNSGSFTYNIPVPASGNYAVRLHFAEIFFGVETSSGLGARVFNVNVEGGQGQLTNYDIIAEVGAPATSLVATFNNVAVTDGFFTIAFNGVTNNPKISGIELFGIDTPPSPPFVTNPGDQILSTGESVNIQVNANDPNIGDVITYQAIGLPAGLSIDPSTGLITGTLTASVGDYNVTVQATDDGGLFGEASFTMTVGNFIPVIRINSGGAAYSFGGVNWSADQYNNGADQYSNAVPIAATSNDMLYHTERFDASGTFAYEIPVPAAGNYALRLHFAEIFFGVETSSGLGSRIFDVNIEGGQGILSNYDIIAQVGAPATAIMVSFNNVNVTDGFLTVTFSGVVNNPKISGIELFEIGDAPPVLSPIGNQTLAEGEILDVPISASDADGGPPSITAINLPSFATLTDNGDGSAVLSLTPGLVDQGTYTVTVTATDDDGLTDSETLDLIITGVNQPPVLAQIGDQSVDEGSTLDVGVSATDPDGETPVLSATGLPAFASFTDNNDGTGILSLAPGFTDAGDYTITVIATDGGDLTDEETITVSVNDQNAPPDLEVTVDQSVNEGELLEVILTATDPDGDIPSFNFDGDPSFVTLSDNNDGTALLSINPGFNDNGMYDITVSVEDSGGLIDQETFQLTVNDSNGAPVLVPVGDHTVAEGNSLDVPVSASDPDNDIPVISIIGLPAFASFVDNNNGTATITLSPGFTDEGVYNLTIVATDDTGLSDQEDIVVTVTDLNSPPVLDVISDQTIPEGEALSLLVTASDPGGEIPSLSASGQPAFVSFNDNSDGTGTFVITPGYTDVGMYTITVIATDGIFDDSQSFVLTVSEVNAAPVLANIPTQTLEEGSTGQFDISASDPDMEVPSISFQGLEPWMVFTDNGDGSGTLNLAPDFNQFGNYTIAVIVTDGAGLSDEQQVVIMVTEVTEEPVWTVTGTVKNANCLNEQGSIVLSVSGGFGELAYSWSNGATTRDIFDLASGVYSVIITDQKNNTNVKTFTVNTQPGPQKPMISLESENVLVSTPASSYQWNLDGEVIEGETGQSIEVTLSGEYSVSITDDLGCTVMSDPYSISYEYSELNVYPNPTDGQFTAEVILMEDEMLSFVLIDEIGRQTPLKVADLKAGRHELEFTLSESLANGVYILMNNGKSFASNTNRIVLFR